MKKSEGLKDNGLRKDVKIKLIVAPEVIYTVEIELNLIYVRILPFISGLLTTPEIGWMRLILPLLY
jgi:hypothetical protein